jgi:acetyl-CoA synthetase
LMTGTPSILYQGSFSPAATWAILERERVTNFSAAPTVYRSLRSAQSPPSGRIRLRCASSAGEPLTPEVNAWAQEALGASVHDHYGQTEMGMLINNHHHPRLKKPLKAGSMGHVMPGFTAVVLKQEADELAAPGETGRIALDLAESPLAFFRGYHEETAKSAEKFTGNGRWYLTGDTGAVDADGYFNFSSRDDDIILMAGYRIGPSEVESVLQLHPDIVESAVIAVPDGIRGEVMEAFVVLKDAEKAGRTLEEELKQWVKKRYAAHAFPRVIHVVPQLPKTPSGKIQRNLLRHQRRVELAQQADDARSAQAAVP